MLPIFRRQKDACVEQSRSWAKGVAHRDSILTSPTSTTSQDAAPNSPNPRTITIESRSVAVPTTAPRATTTVNRAAWTTVAPIGACTSNIDSTAAGDRPQTISPTPVNTTTACSSSALKEAGVNRRVASWNAATTITAPLITVVPLMKEEEESEGSHSGSSSPTLSGSSRSKGSCDTPRATALEAAGGEENTTAAAIRVEGASPDMLLRTLPDTVHASSFITPCATYTASSDSSESSSASLSPVPSFSMADIIAALRSTPEGRHPFLDMDYQCQLRENEAAQTAWNHHDVHSSQTKYSPAQQAAAFKGLLNAAHRHQFDQCMARDAAAERSADPTSPARAPTAEGRWGPRQRRLIHRQWRMTAEMAECDLYREGLSAVQRKLSCMGLFNPDTDVRVYENGNMGEQRLYRQHKLLVRLQKQRFRGGNPYFVDAAQ